uniref:Protein kinase c conserved region 2 n=1 Tax=Rhipicephalus microplus TaxID=6941 RepID=A0A6G5ADR5_RHIMP
MYQTAYNNTTTPMTSGLNNPGTNPINNYGANSLTTGGTMNTWNPTPGTRTVQDGSVADRCLPHRNSNGLGHGTLTLRPIEGRFIEDKDLIGKMDPYCKFKLGFHRGKSSVAKNQGKNPMWNDVITLKAKGQEFAKLKCKDRDRLSLNDRLGKAQIPLNEVYVNGKSSKWYTLQKRGKITGEVLVEMEFVPTRVV